MAKYILPEYLVDRYEELKDRIRHRLWEFTQVPSKEYFYEMCYCICTPQSKAKSAFLVVEKLKNADFAKKLFDPVNILRNPEHYIRFHNQKSLRLIDLGEIFPTVLKILDSKDDKYLKREKIHKTVKGFGFKETSHFLRNIGYSGFGILDRHILKHLVECGVYKEIPKVSSVSQYIEVEKGFLALAKSVGIPIDELDMLFWSYETGEILK
jgi:N-glycosylase/DNA lyase